MNLLFYLKLKQQQQEHLLALARAYYLSGLQSRHSLLLACMAILNSITANFSVLLVSICLRPDAR